MNTISPEEFKKRYGTQGVASFKEPEKKGIGTTIKNAFKSGISYAKEGASQVGNSRSGNPLDLISGVGKAVAGGVQAALSPLAPVIKPIMETRPAQILMGQDVIKAAERSPQVQKFAESKLGQGVARGAEDVKNYADFAGLVGGGMKAPKVGSAIRTGVSDVAETLGSGVSKGSKALKGTAGDVVPTAGRFVNEQVAQALEMTPGDLKNIFKSTGNDVGQFMADKNLIGKNVKETSGLLENFSKQNYDAVRAELGKVKNTYDAVKAPRYQEALTELKKQISETPGLQKANAEVDALLNKKVISLEDVQRVKELMDDHFNLYKMTGDVKEGIAKEGLANIRKDLQVFIENEVKQATGAEIGAMNNNVSTSRSILNTIENRASRGLTRSQLSLGDLGIFGSATLVTGGNPLFGIALVFAKKLLQSPSIRLRMAKYIDGLSDARKMIIQQELQEGKIPMELNQFVKGNKTTQVIEPQKLEYFEPNKNPNKLIKVNNYQKPNNPSYRTQDQIKAETKKLNN